MPGADPAGELDRLLAPLLARPASTALLFDFDGTLSPTVADPAAARPADGVDDLLVALAARYRAVAVVSGRPVGFLAEVLSPGPLLSGQYGLERRRADGSVARVDGADPAVVDRAHQDLLGWGIDPAAIEPKGLTLTVHFRTRPETEADVRTAVEAVARARGLAVHDAKRSVELRPDVAVDKGTVVAELAEGADQVLYVGDDVGDLPAFVALHDARASGVTAVSVAVDGPELPDAVRAAADVTVPGQGGVVALLRRLAAGA